MDAFEAMIQQMKQTHTQTSSSKDSNENVCPMCNGTGWHNFYDKDGILWSEVCKCGIRKREIIKDVLSFANIPESFKDIRLESFDIQAYSTNESRNKAKTVVKCINYWLSEFEALKSRGMGLYLYSKTKGSGKTRMAVSVANELVYEKDFSVKFCTSLQILNEIKATWNKSDNSTESELLEKLSSVEILIIDDFGTEQSEKSWINERFYQIINNRYIDKKITIFTSNERLDLLKYDDRITNRIKERVFQIPFPEESIRDSIAKSNMIELVNGVRNGA